MPRKKLEPGGPKIHEINNLRHVLSISGTDRNILTRELLRDHVRHEGIPAEPEDRGRLALDAVDLADNLLLALATPGEEECGDAESAVASQNPAPPDA